MKSHDWQSKVYERTIGRIQQQQKELPKSMVRNTLLYFVEFSTHYMYFIDDKFRWSKNELGKV